MINPIFADTTTDIWEHWSFIATVWAAIFSGIWAVWQWQQEGEQRRQDQAKERESKRQELLQRERELRWQQAKLARKMMDGIFDYDPSNDAWRMVDGEEDGYKDRQGNEYIIDMSVVRKALPMPWSDDRSGPELYVRWCFDALFYSLEQLEHSIQLNILRFEDLEASASYYVALMAQNKKLFQNYAELIRFHRAVQFMERFSEWRSA